MAGLVHLDGEDAEVAALVVVVVDRLLEGAGELLDARLQDVREADQQRQPDAALGDLVDHVVERLVLLLEELVQIVELRPDDVPVVVPGLGIEHVLVGEQVVQDPDHAVAVGFGQSDIECHRSLLTLLMRRPGRRLRTYCLAMT